MQIEPALSVSAGHEDTPHLAKRYCSLIFADDLALRTATADKRFAVGEVQTRCLATTSLIGDNK
jgi:hypothetical protein